MKNVISVLALLNASLSPASADFYSYSKLAPLSNESQVAYIAGVIDALSAADQSIGPCIVYKLDTRLGQLSSNIMAYLATQPQLHAGTMPENVMIYLQKACAPKAPSGK